mgnify:CR=1 FL=1
MTGSVCAAGVPNFASWTNIVNILYHTTIMSMLVLAPGLVILAGTKWFPGTILANPYVALALTLATGALLGLFNGVCVSRLGMNAFMQTLSLSIILRGLTLFLIPLAPIFSFVGKARFAALGNVPAAVFVTSGICVVFHVVLKHTVFGRNYLATGGNERASYVAGIDTRKMIVAGVVIAGTSSTVAGLLTTGRQDSVSNTMGNGMTMLAFPGALLDGTSMSGGKGKWNNTDSHAKASDMLTRYGGKVLGIYVQTPDIMGAGVVSAIEAARLQAKDFGICGISASVPRASTSSRRERSWRSSNSPRTTRRFSPCSTSTT